MAYKAPPPARKDEKDNFIIPGSVFDRILPKENGNLDKRAKEQKKMSPKTQSTDTSKSGLKPKLLFIRIPSDETTHQIHEDESLRGCEDSESLMSKYVSE